MHADQLHHLQALAARKGVTDLVPGWLVAPSTPDGDWSGHRVEDLYPETTVMWRICPTTVPFIVTGSLAAWLAGQGIAVFYDTEGERWFSIHWNGDDLISSHIEDATDHLSALIAAATARLEEMPSLPADGGAE